MQCNQQTFINLCIDNSILRFGEFQLKSGRVSPYFFNAGLFHNGRLLNELSRYYADLIHTRVDFPYMLYGPAYKGIPLASATAMQLASTYDTVIDYAFNRKEAKDHGEGGTIVGAPLRGNIIIIDDVITAGTSVGESIEIIQEAGAKPAAVIIALDRQETITKGSLSAVQSVEKNWGIPVFAIIQLNDLIVHLRSNSQNADIARKVEEYRKNYGCEA